MCSAPRGGLTLVEERFAVLIARIHRSGIAAPGQLRGCTDAELAELAARYGLALPKAYQLFLKSMGHGSRRLFAADHVDTRYAAVLALTEHVRSTGVAIDPGFELPADALIISEWLGDDLLFIRCTGDDNPPVWAVEGNTVRHRSVLDWLEFWCDTAERAIASGYFRSAGKGASPWNW